MQKREENIQLELCDWLRMFYPDIIFRSDGGGVRMTIGSAVKFRRMQSGKAYPDLFLPEPRQLYHGLFLEIKAAEGDLYKKNGEIRQSQHIKRQADMLQRLSQRGYLATWGIGLNNCQDVIKCYLEE